MDQGWQSQDHKTGGTHLCPHWLCSTPEKEFWGEARGSGWLTSVPWGGGFATMAEQSWKGVVRA